MSASTSWHEHEHLPLNSSYTQFALTQSASELSYVLQSDIAPTKCPAARMIQTRATFTISNAAPNKTKERFRTLLRDECSWGECAAPCRNGGMVLVRLARYKRTHIDRAVQCRPTIRSTGGCRTYVRSYVNAKSGSRPDTIPSVLGS